MTSATTPRSPHERKRVLIGAAACGPCDEPEANAGWAFAVAAADRHDVWVVTRPRLREQIDAAFAANPGLADHLHVEYLDLSDWLIARRKHSWDLYWFYALWQRALQKRAVALHRRHEFDVAHHVTFANDWLPCGLTGLADVPLVWGPVGGSSQFPLWRLRRWLGLRGFAGELVRRVSTGVPRRFWGDRIADRAAVVIAQNDDVAARFRVSGRLVIVEPNAALDDVQTQPPRDPHQPPTALFAGRLIGWKGARLAVATMARPEVAHWRLRIFGDGYDRVQLEQMASRLGVADRVEFAGHRPRAELLEAYGTADAFLFPSLHDQAGWVVAEASSAGCPVVCLPLGGPPILAGPNAYVASLRGDVVANLAAQLVAAESGRGAPHHRWSSERLPALVEQWYGCAIDRHYEGVA